MVGFNCKDKSILDQKYICPKCQLIYRQPVQFINCGHRYCKSCIPPIASGSTIACDQCHQTAAEDEVRYDQGFARDLQALFITCFLCSWTGSLRDYTVHLDQVHPTSVCEYCDRRFDSGGSLATHQEFQCPAIPVSCPLKSVGCSDRMMRGQLRDHYHTRQHYQAMMKAIGQITRQSPNSNLVLESAVDPSEMDFQSLSDLTNVIVDALKIIKDDNQCLNEELSKQEQISNDYFKRHGEMKLSMEETNSFVEGLKLNVGVLEQDAAALREQVEHREHASYDGTCIWKITGFREKLMDAQSERQTSVYSPPFYSSPTGYKMRARAYLHGDGHARRTHMSLFFVLMRSSNDALLKFPFDYKVTFCLYDQTPTQRHIVDSFRPDIRSNSFQRPKSEMNIASGIPKFVPLEMIEREDSPYVRDDAMFIKIMVDFVNTPKSALPFIISLDPGLPVHVQQAMIREEVERKEQQQQSAAATKA